jgi:hypothetical protein
MVSDPLLLFQVSPVDIHPISFQKESTSRQRWIQKKLSDPVPNILQHPTVARGTQSIYRKVAPADDSRIFQLCVAIIFSRLLKI